MLKSVYIHIPFCKKICSYCDFCKLYYKESWASSYLIKLKEEINDRYNGEEINTIYIGGGTPSILSKENLNYLMDIIKVFKTKNLEEFTFECNIEDISEELLTILKINKVNRLSIGIESVNKDNLKFMNREIVDEKYILEKISLVRNIGFTNYNIDIMYAIPNETLKVLKQDIKKIVNLKPTHISTYSLIIEDNTMLKNNKVNNIDEELDYDMYKYIEKYLKKHYYNHYEVSNFALDNYESKHNMKTWNNEEYYGFGLSSSGYIDNIRYTNTKNLKEYLMGNYVSESHIVGKKEKMDNHLMLGLRKIKGINVDDFNTKYETNIFLEYPNIKALIKNKDIIFKKGNIYINLDKIYIMNEILIKII